MFSYCNNSPISCSDSHGARPVSILERFGDTAIPIPPKKTRKNDAAVSAFYGVSSSKNIPEIPDGAMLFVENITSVNVGKYGSIIRGKTLVMDRDKYCEYTFWGIGAGLGGVGNVPLDMAYTKGYVYGVTDIADYCGLFLGGSNNLVASIQGGAWAPGGVHAEIIGGTNVAASLGCSATYYVTSQSDWIYGAADFYVVPNAYQYSPLNSNMYI